MFVKMICVGHIRSSGQTPPVVCVSFCRQTLCQLLVSFNMIPDSTDHLVVGL